MHHFLAAASIAAVALSTPAVASTITYTYTGSVRPYSSDHAGQSFTAVFTGGSTSASTDIAGNSTLSFDTASFTYGNGTQEYLGGDDIRASVAAHMGYNEVTYLVNSSNGGLGSYLYLGFTSSSDEVDGDPAKPGTFSNPFVSGELFSINTDISTGEPIPVIRSLAFDVDKLTIENPGYATSPVPLPASVNLLGAALLGLGAVGYVAKRKKGAIAA